MAKKTPITKSPVTYKDFDIHVGISYAGSEEQYVKVLRRYFSMIQAKAKRIKQCCEQEEIEEYTIEVHALKSNSRLIGAIALADEAEYLEQCGLSGNIAEIKAKTPALLSSFKGIKKLFNFVLLEDDQPVGELEITQEETKEKYEAIIEALDSFDIDTAAELLDSLINYNISGRQSEYIFRAKKKVVDFAYDKAITIMKDALKALEDEKKRKKRDAKVKQSILIVDDNEMNRTLATELLEEIGVCAVPAESGKECLEILKKQKFDLVLLDQMMPEMDGESTLKHIKDEKLAEGTPIVVLTADSKPGSREKYLKKGFDDYLAKPMYLDNVCSLLEKYKKENRD